MKHSRRVHQGTARGRQKRCLARGVALLLVLIAVMLASILGHAYIATQNTSIVIARNITNGSKARYVAESGLELVMAYLRADQRSEEHTSELQSPY